MQATALVVAQNPQGAGAHRGGNRMQGVGGPRSPVLGGLFEPPCLSSVLWKHRDRPCWLCPREPSVKFDHRAQMRLSLGLRGKAGGMGCRTRGVFGQPCVPGSELPAGWATSSTSAPAH